MGFIFITDREEADLDHFLDLRGKIIDRTATPLEWDEFLLEMRGRYNPLTLNRVGLIVQEIGALINVIVNPKTDWVYADVPSPVQFQQYLDDIEAIRARIAPTLEAPESVPVYIIPPTPSTMDNLTLELANDIETILLYATAFIELLQGIYLPCGYAWSGDNFYLLSSKSWDSGKSVLQSGMAQSGTQFFPITI